MSTTQNMSTTQHTMSTVHNTSSAVTSLTSSPLLPGPTVPPVPKAVRDVGEIVLIVVLPVVAVAASLCWCLWWYRRRRLQRMRSASTSANDTSIRPYGVSADVGSHSPSAVAEQRHEKVERALDKDSRSRSAVTPYTEFRNAAAEHRPAKGTTPPPATVPGDIGAQSSDTAVVVEAATDAPRSDPVMLAALDDAVRGAGFSVVALLSSLNRVRHAGDDEATMPPMYEPDGVAASSHA